MPIRDRDLASFQQDFQKYEGSRDAYDANHSRLYGKEEGLPHKKHEFPRGSDRQRRHEQYTASTKPKDRAKAVYEKDFAAARKDFDGMSEEEKAFYDQETGGLTPLQHERLDPRSRDYRDKSYSNATGRENFLKAHPYGYHSVEDQQKHHRYAKNAFTDYEHAKGRQELHERNRSYSNADSRKDQFGRPVASRR